jgi:hypothetical protein
VIKFVSDLRQDGGFLRVLRFPPPIKLTRHEITEILLKVALNTIDQTKRKLDVKTTMLTVEHKCLWLVYFLMLLMIV